MKYGYLLITAIILAISNNANAALSSDAVLDFGGSSLERTCLSYPDAADPSGCAYGAYDDELVGSYFAIDTDGSGIFEANERNATTGTGNGITLGTAQAAGEIDSWDFFGATGYHWTAAAPTIVSDDLVGNVTVDLNWWLNWDASNIDVSSNPQPVDNAIIKCGSTCEAGDSFILDYSADIAPCDQFACPSYALHLEGTISSVPVPAAVWLFGSGLIGLVGFARRKNA